MLGQSGILFLNSGDSIPFTCHDTYAGYLGARIDLWMPTIEACYAITGWHDVVWN